MREKNSDTNRSLRRFVAGKLLALDKNLIFWHWKHQLTLKLIKSSHKTVFLWQFCLFLFVLNFSILRLDDNHSND
jgi:hypothetical protein